MIQVLLPLSATEEMVQHVADNVMLIRFILFKSRHFTSFKLAQFILLLLKY